MQCEYGDSTSVLKRIEHRQVLPDGLMDRWTDGWIGRDLFIQTLAPLVVATGDKNKLYKVWQ